MLESASTPSRHRSLQAALRHAESEIVRPIVPSSPATALASAPLVQSARLPGVCSKSAVLVLLNTRQVCDLPRSL